MEERRGSDRQLQTDERQPDSGRQTEPGENELIKMTLLFQVAYQQ